MVFLWLDRNRNGIVDNGSELFGNNSPGLNGETAENGFEALRVLDANGDGALDGQDPVWGRLLLWSDLDHDGFSTPAEISAVGAVGIRLISLEYRATRRVDEFGNLFQYKGEMLLDNPQGRPMPRPIYDISFVEFP
jgi:hypothetical protein